MCAAEVAVAKQTTSKRSFNVQPTRPHKASSGMRDSSLAYPSPRVAVDAPRQGPRANNQRPVATWS